MGYLPKDKEQLRELDSGGIQAVFPWSKGTAATLVAAICSASSLVTAPPHICSKMTIFPPKAPDVLKKSQIVTSTRQSRTTPNS